MVRRKQTLSTEHADVLWQWKHRGFLAPDFEYEELTSHYMEQLNKAAKNLTGSIYEEHHKGEKVCIYRETTVMTNEEQSMTSKCLLLQSGQNQYSEEARQHLLQKYSSETVMATSKVNSLSSLQSVLFCLDNVPETYGKEQLKDAIVELLVTNPSKCVAELKCHLQKTTRSYYRFIWFPHSSSLSEMSIVSFKSLSKLRFTFSNSSSLPGRLGSSVMYIT